MRWPWRGSPLVVITAVVLSPRNAGAFFDDIFQQAFGGGGGGGGFQFQMGGDGFQQIHMGGGRQQKQIKFPKGISDKISKKFSWMKGTEWNWNSWRNVKFEKDGSFEAPTKDCGGRNKGRCKWSANKNSIYVMFGDAGLHELQVQGEMPKDASNPAELQNLRMSGTRAKDGDKVHATFTRVFDNEAAELEKDLYDILGLQDGADDADIKKSYRKLSIKYHPDKNPDEESRRKFNNIRDAYEILNDPDKKILYDTGGMEAVKQLEKGEVERGSDVNVGLDVTLSDLYNSADSQSSINRMIVCFGCRRKPDNPNCQGCSRCPNEVKMVNRQVGPGMFIQQQQEVQSKEKCKHEDTVLDVHVEKGMSDGDSITFARMNEQRPGMIPGNVIFNLKVRKEKRFVRKGNDLHMNAKITLREALLGFEHKIRHMDGHTVTFGTEGVTAPFQVFKIAGEGMPLRDDPASFGDLYVTMEIVFPKSLAKDARNKVDGIFSERSPTEEL